MLLTPGRPDSTGTGPSTRIITALPEAPHGAPAPENTGSKGKFARTMVGIAPFSSVASAKPSGSGTASELGDVSSQEPPAPVAPRAASAAGRSKHGTMLGLAFPIPQVSAEKPPPQPEESSRPPDTLIGAGEFVAPGPAPLPFKDAAKGTLIGTGEFVAPGPSPLPFKDAAKGTLIGVAVPGVAPINPGVPKASADAESAPKVQNATRGFGRPQAETQRVVGTSSTRVLLWSLAGVAVALCVVAVVAVWRWKAAPRLDVQVVSDEAGKDALSIECKNCDDTVVFGLADAKSQVRNHVARLPLRAPLKIGMNEVTVSVSRGTARPEPVQLRVPVDFRITGDTSGLDENPTKLRLRIQKTATVDFKVNHQPIQFSPDGKGVFELDVSSELIGPSAQAKTVEKKISYQVRSNGSSFENSSTLRAVVTPLVVTVPGSILVTEGADLRICGHTDPGARVEIAGLQTSVNSEGAFCSAAVIRELGRFDVWVAARRPGAAPRKVKLTIERTVSLRQYAKELFPRIAHDVPADRKAQVILPEDLVALTGVVIEQSKSPDATRYLLKMDLTGGSNFARITSYTSTPAKVGARVTVFGEPREPLSGPDGRMMHELAAAFEVPALR